MWRFKGCPRCKGDMQADRDDDGWYEWCLQCGYRHDLVDIIEVKPHARVEETDGKEAREGPLATTLPMRKEITMKVQRE